MSWPQRVELPYQVDGQPVRICPFRDDPTLENWAPDDADGEYDYVMHPNWRILGAMNVYDKSYLFAMSFAFMRRFAFIDLDLPEPDAYEKLIRRWINEMLRAKGKPGILDAAAPPQFFERFAEAIAARKLYYAATSDWSSHRQRHDRIHLQSPR